MAKRTKENEKSEASPLSHNPFAALSPTPSAAITSTKEAKPHDPNEKTGAQAEGTPKWTGKVVLAREKKGRGGKTVTRVSGLPAARLEELKSSMKKSLGCGASIEEGDLLLHGSLTERAGAWLEKAGAPKVVIGN